MQAIEKRRAEKSKEEGPGEDHHRDRKGTQRQLEYQERDQIEEESWFEQNECWKCFYRMPQCRSLKWN
jgi:hypothetical protein